MQLLFKYVVIIALLSISCYSLILLALKTALYHRYVIEIKAYHMEDSVLAKISAFQGDLEMYLLK